MKSTFTRGMLIHTQAKLEIFENYLIQYLQVLINAEFINNINIYDIFCGSGIYDDGKKGSPILALI